MTVTTVINGTIELHIESTHEIEQSILQMFTTHLAKGGTVEVSIGKNNYELVLSVYQL